MAGVESRYALARHDVPQPDRSVLAGSGVLLAVGRAAHLVDAACVVALGD